MSSLFIIHVYIHHDDEPLMTDFMNVHFPSRYACEFPIKRTDSFDMVYHIYSNNPEEEQLTRQFLETHIPISPYIIDATQIDNSVWQDKWKEHFHPQSIGKHLYLTLPWDKTKTPTGRKRLIIDPGMAFGTGAHATTRGCLIYIDKHIKQGIVVADIGTGSGVLAIASAKMGARVTAIDNDAVATENATTNIQTNRVTSKIMLLTGDLSVLPVLPYDIVIANLTADLHLQFFENYKELSHHFILSGISDFRKTQMDLFLNTLEIKPTDVYEEDGWYTYWIVL